MVWSPSKGTDYLLKSYYDERGKRRQQSLGRRGPETEELKRRFDEERASTVTARQEIEAILDRQAAVNRALGLGRIPRTPAHIIQALDAKGLLGVGIRIAGTNALYAYEAACGVHIDAAITATNDIDLLFDTRSKLDLLADGEFGDRSLLKLIQGTDRSFTRTSNTYRARNREGYIVDLIKPVRDPPWAAGRKPSTSDDLEAVEIEGLVWLENAQPFEQVSVDDRGFPVRLIVPDPRVFAIHKHWLSQRPERERLKVRRDHAQAEVVAKLLRMFLPHLPLDPRQLRILPRKAVHDFLSEFPE